jgi:sugar lactone lactonase YvrE
MPTHGYRASARGIAGLLALTALVGGCSTKLTDSSPPTVEPARPAVSPAPAGTPAGDVTPVTGRPEYALYDGATASLVLFTPGPGAALTVAGRTGAPRAITLPAPATAVAGAGDGTVYASTRGGFLAIDVAAGAVSRTEIAGESATDFTAIARRADGRLVLGSADGAAYTLADDLTVSRKTDDFARVDAIVTVGDIAVVLDRGQTSVTALNTDGAAVQALRAGLGATSITADPMGRVLVTDTRGGQLLVFSVDPLIERQAYPVSDSPFGVAGSRQWVWVSQTATNTVVGYDLGTGIPVEKVRYPSVQQPNSLAFDDSSGTLYVVSATGGGVQVIRDAAGRR